MSNALVTALVLFGALGCSSGGTTYVSQATDAGVAEASEAAEAPKKDAASNVEEATTEEEPLEPLACAQKPNGTFVRVDNNPTGNLPESTGGALEDGHYVLKQAIVMSSGTFPKLAGNLWIRDGRYEWQTENSDGWNYAYGGKVKASNVRLIMTVDCGGQTSAPSWRYSATAAELTVTFTNINGFSWVYVLKRVS